MKETFLQIIKDQLKTTATGFLNPTVSVDQLANSNLLVLFTAECEISIDDISDQSYDTRIILSRLLFNPELIEYIISLKGNIIDNVKYKHHYELEMDKIKSASGKNETR